MKRLGSVEDAFSGAHLRRRARSSPPSLQAFLAAEVPVEVRQRHVHDAAVLVAQALASEAPGIAGSERAPGASSPAIIRRRAAASGCRDAGVAVSWATVRGFAGSELSTVRARPSNQLRCRRRRLRRRRGRASRCPVGSGAIRGPRRGGGGWTAAVSPATYVRTPWAMSAAQTVSTSVSLSAAQCGSSSPSTAAPAWCGNAVGRSDRRPR
jgi:hypothetical protein